MKTDGNKNALTLKCNDSYAPMQHLNKKPSTPLTHSLIGSDAFIMDALPQ